MDAVELARLQFAFTIGFHILWPTFTIGIACFVAWLSGLWWWTGKVAYRDLMRFWTRIFALGFGMGVVTGIVLSYEIGTNWAGFSRSVANVLGPLFMYEALTAFFLEFGFIGIVLFGEGRVSKGMHFFSCCMVAGGTLLSATWIIASNSWMQTPAGAVADAQGIYHVVDWWQVVFNPVVPLPPCAHGVRERSHRFLRRRRRLGLPPVAPPAPDNLTHRLLHGHVDGPGSGAAPDRAG